MEHVESHTLRQEAAAVADWRWARDRGRSVAGRRSTRTRTLWLQASQSLHLIFGFRPSPAREFLALSAGVVLRPRLLVLLRETIRSVDPPVGMHSRHRKASRADPATSVHRAGTKPCASRAWMRVHACFAARRKLAADWAR
eukprot:1327569-Prymnesium_polylepis.1